MVTLAGISKSYRDRVLLADGLVGPNGAGKSTLSSIISGRTRPTMARFQSSATLAIGYPLQGAPVGDERAMMFSLKTDVE
jgi:ATPase subunit of ABC transporter with duplicated ATPase domains